MEAGTRQTRTRAELFEEIRRRLLPLRPERIVVFGSQARGDAGPDSDVDIMVVLDFDGTLGERSRRVRPALRGIGLPMDLFVYTPDEYLRVRRLFSSVASIAEREGVVLHG